MERRHNTRHAAALAAAAAAKGSRSYATRGDGSRDASRDSSPSQPPQPQQQRGATTTPRAPTTIQDSPRGGAPSSESSSVTSVEGGADASRSSRDRATDTGGSPTRGEMYESFQTWAMKTYGDSAKTKTVTRRKYNRIAKILQGEEMNSAENSKFRFWVKAKGFRMGPPVKSEPSDATPPPKKKKLDESQILYVPCGKTSPGNVKDDENAIYKKVAVVENFYDIIYEVHVEMDGRGGKHAGQKRTYKAIAETYAFLPREAVTHFLMSCSDCQKRMHLAAEGGGGGRTAKSQAPHSNGESDPSSSPADSVSSALAAAAPRVSPVDELVGVDPPEIDYSMPITTTYLKHMRRLGYIDEDAVNVEREPDSISNSDESEMSEAAPASQDGTLNSAECQTDEVNSGEELSNTFEASVAAADDGTLGTDPASPPRSQGEPEEEEERDDKEEEEGPIDMTPVRQIVKEEPTERQNEPPCRTSPEGQLKTELWCSPSTIVTDPINYARGATEIKRAPPSYYAPTRVTAATTNTACPTNAQTRESPYEHIMNSPNGGGTGPETLVDNLSVSTKEEDDEDEDEDADKIDPNQCDPERLKAFNMFVRLFVDENLDRMIPISRQPKEKIQAIIDSCSRQFPEFGDRARKRIRTYLKSCRRNKRTREQCGWDMVRPQSRPTLPHLTSALAEQILASACENESQNAKRMRLGLKPIAVQLEEVNPHAAVKGTSVHATCAPSDLDSRLGQQPTTGVKSVKETVKSQPFTAPHHPHLAGGHHSPIRSGTTAAPSVCPNAANVGATTAPATSVNLNGAIAAAAAAAAVSGQSNNNNNATCASRYQGLVYSHVPTHNPAATSNPPAPVVAAAAPTDLSVKKERCPTSSVLKYTLNANEVTAVKQLICGYRESAAFLLRSADELEQLLLQQN